jgi:CzcA family heavy metal efflux pump
MLERIVVWSIRFRGVVVAVALVLLGYGIYVTAHARLDVFPEFAPPQVNIQTETPGLAPEETEALVTRPIENAVNGVSGLQSLRSQSIQGLSVVIAIFAPGTDIMRARQLVGERLQEVAGRLPRDVATPTMAPLTSATSTMLVLGLTSTRRSLVELRTFADWTLRPQLLAVPGVAKVVIFGGEVRQLQIQVRPERLQAYGLAIGDVLAAGRQATAVRGAGFVDTGPQRITLRTEGQSLTAAELGQVVITHQNGLSVRLKDVARVVDGPEPKQGDAAIMGRPGVMLAVSSQFGGNTIQVTRSVERVLSQLAPAISSEEMELQPALFRPADFVRTATSNVEWSLLLGGALVAVVLFVFLVDLRTAFISFTSIPLSLLAAVIVLDRMGASLNTLTLGGLAIAIGIVVDDAIIDVENVWRRLRENAAPHRARPHFDVIRDAVLEVRSPVVYATVIVAVIFLPILTLPGVEGRLFGPLAVTAILAILASLGVALTVTPALCFLLLADLTPRGEPRYITWLKHGHRRVLEALGRHPAGVIGAVGALCVTAVAMLPLFGGSFLPELREGHFIVHMAATPGTSIEESMRLGNRVTGALLTLPRVHSVAQRAGRAEQADDTNGPYYSEFDVDLKTMGGEEIEAAEADIRRTLAQFPGVSFAVKPFLTERIEETISGSTAQVVVKVFGEDLDLIESKAQEVARVLSETRGAAEVQVQSPPGLPEMVVRLRPDRLTQFGFRPVDVLDAIQTTYQGATVAQTYEGNRVFDVVVVLDPMARRNPESIGAVVLKNADGLRLPLGELAEVEPSTGRYAVFHDGTRRVQLVTGDVVGRDVVSFVAEAQRKIHAEMTAPAGVSLVFTGAAEARTQAQRQLLLHAAMAAVGSVLLLAVVLRRLRNLLLVLANLPFALVGAVLAVFATGGWLSIGSLVGFVTLFGITTRNSILLISHYEHLVAVEGVEWGLEATLRGAGERFVPILMTALVTALGLLPLAIGSGAPGREIEGPMAIVILGGLATSTALNLLVLPTFALRYGRFAAQADVP